MIKCKGRAKVASHQSAQNSSLALGFTVMGTQGTHPANPCSGQDPVLSLNFLDSVGELGVLGLEERLART